MAEILELISPQAPLQDPDALKIFMDLSFRVGTIELQRGLIQSILSTGELDIAQKTGQMTRYPASGFEASSAAVQRDMRIQGLFGNRGMLIEDTDERLRRLDVPGGRRTDAHPRNPVVVAVSASLHTGMIPLGA